MSEVAGGSPTRRVRAVPSHLKSDDFAVEQLDCVVGSENVGSPVAGFASVSTSMSTSMSRVSCGRFGMLILNVIIPVSSLETTMVVMSGAAGFSPVESW